MKRTWQPPGTYTGTRAAMKAVGHARLELSGVSTPHHLWPHGGGVELSTSTPLIGPGWSGMAGHGGGAR